MAELRQKFEDKPQIWVSLIVVAVGIVITMVGSIDKLHYWLNRQLSLPSAIRASLIAIGTALLGAGFINLSDVWIRHRRYRRYIKPFEEFWGQEWRGETAGRILLQADSIRSLADKFPREQDGPPAVDLSWADKSDNRVFKARAWLNRYDTEGAKEIREVFGRRGFDPPSFQAVERDVDLKSESNRPFDIWMGLGFTASLADKVNEIAKGHLSIKIDPKHGDLIDIHLKHVPENAPEELDYQDPRAKQFYRLVPKDWDHDKFTSIEQQKDGIYDYGYILRYRSNDDKEASDRILFHVGGFTEHGTWAAGHYLAHHWEEIYESCVKAELGQAKELAVIVLAGRSPFRPEAQQNYDSGREDSAWAWWEVTHMVWRGDDLIPKRTSERPAPRRGRKVD